jgi:hypothetical protein
MPPSLSSRLLTSLSTWPSPQCNCLRLKRRSAGAPQRFAVVSSICPRSRPRVMHLTGPAVAHKRRPKSKISLPAQQQRWQSPSSKRPDCPPASAVCTGELAAAASAVSTQHAQCSRSSAGPSALAPHTSIRALAGCGEQLPRRLRQHCAPALAATAQRHARCELMHPVRSTCAAAPDRLRRRAPYASCSRECLRCLTPSFCRQHANPRCAAAP